MRANQILHRILSENCIDMHKERRAALGVGVMAALQGQSLTVTHLGRAIESDAKEKHCIKRADRLLSNSHLHRERLSIYSNITTLFISNQTRPIISVDWSDMDAYKRHFLLRASLSLNGRALTLYEEVYPLETKEKPKSHLEFLRTLHSILPLQCRPIIVSDAGFRTPWFKQVESFGWDWVGRVRNRDHVWIHEQWLPCKSLYCRATATPRYLGNVLLTRRNAKPCHLVLYKGKAKGRVHLNRSGKPVRSARSRQNARAQKEPWLLATSLSVGSKLAEKVVNIYRLRMQIEESFRDLKSTRFGLSLELHLTYQVQRLQILLLIAMLALMVAWLLGKALELTNQHRQYQANTVKTRNVLSTIFLGLRVIDDHRVNLQRSDIVAAWHKLFEEVAENCL